MLLYTHHKQEVNSMKKIQSISKYIRTLLILIAVLHLFVYASILIFADTTHSSSHLSVSYHIFTSNISIDFQDSWKGFSQALSQEGFNSSLILGIAESVPYLFIYFFLFKLFGLYQQGIIFTYKNSFYIKCIATSLLGWIGVSLFYPIIVTLLIRFTGQSNTLPMMINFGSTEMKYLMISLIIYAFAWIMKEAIKIKSDQELVI